MRLGIRYACAVFFLLAGMCPGATLTEDAKRAFDSYVAGVEARLVRQHSTPETYLAGADVADSIQPINGGTWAVPGALLHHWRATAFVPGATPVQLRTVLRDFERFYEHYAPEVVTARALADNGQAATVAVRFREQRLITVVLDGEYEVESRLDGKDFGYSSSRGQHFWQVDRPGTPHERRRPEGDDDGYLWRLNSYWSFARVAGGLRMECEAVSLTRDVPSGLGWLIQPMIRDFPREALQFTMTATRKALLNGTLLNSTALEVKR